MVGPSLAPAPLASPLYRTGCRPSPAPPAAGSMPGSRDEAGQGLTKQWFWGPVLSGDEHMQRRRGQENLLGSGVWGHTECVGAERPQKTRGGGSGRGSCRTPRGARAAHWPWGTGAEEPAGHQWQTGAGSQG